MGVMVWWRQVRMVIVRMVIIFDDYLHWHFNHVRRCLWSLSGPESGAERRPVLPSLMINWYLKGQCREPLPRAVDRPSDAGVYPPSWGSASWSSSLTCLSFSCLIWCCTPAPNPKAQQPPRVPQQNLCRLLRCQTCAGLRCLETLKVKVCIWAVQQPQQQPKAPRELITN